MYIFTHFQTGLVFNQKTSSCDRQENLEANDPCRGYYNDTFLEGLGGGKYLYHIDTKNKLGVILNVSLHALLYKHVSFCLIESVH